MISLVLFLKIKIIKQLLIQKDTNLRSKTIKFLEKKQLQCYDLVQKNLFRYNTKVQKKLIRLYQNQNKGYYQETDGLGGKGACLHT